MLKCRKFGFCMENKGVYERIKIIADLHYGNETAMMRALNYAPNTYNTAKNANKEVPTKLLSKIIESNLNINLNWLLKGKGEMYLHSENKNDGVYFNEDEIVYGEEIFETWVNTYGNKFIEYPTGKTIIEVLKIPFRAHASYVESYFEERLQDSFEKVRFEVDKRGSGHYVAFDNDGDSMDSGLGLDSDIPDKSEYLGREIKRELWSNLHRTEKGQVYISKEGIWHKDFKSYNPETGMITLSSRNKKNDEFYVSINDVYQIFNVIKTRKKQ